MDERVWKHEGKTFEEAFADEASRPRHGKKKLRVNYFEKGSAEQKQMLDDMAARMAKFDRIAMDYLADGVEWIARRQDEDKRKAERYGIDTMNQMYARMLLKESASCVTRGRTPEEMMQGGAIFLAGYLTNEDFKKTVDKKAVDMFLPIVREKSEKAGPDSRWAKWQTRLEMAGNDGRVPLTPESAAMAKLALDRKAYHEMRLPGADTDRVREMYDQSCATLYKLAEYDGVGKDVLNRSARSIVGQMMGYDPDLKRFFRETASRDVRKAPGEVSPDGGTVKWSGEFEHKDGTPYTDAFYVREPMDREERLASSRRNIGNGFKRCHTAEDLWDFMQVVQGGDPPEGGRNGKWLRGWKARNDSEYAMMLDDCRTEKDICDMDTDIMNVTMSCFRGWSEMHPEEIQRFCERWNRETGRGGQRDKGPVTPEPAVSDDRSLGCYAEPTACGDGDAGPEMQ